MAPWGDDGGRPLRGGEQEAGLRPAALSPLLSSILQAAGQAGSSALAALHQQSPVAPQAVLVREQVMHSVPRKGWGTLGLTMGLQSWQSKAHWACWEMSYGTQLSCNYRDRFPILFHVS